MRARLELRERHDAAHEIPQAVGGVASRASTWNNPLIPLFTWPLTKHVIAAAGQHRQG